MRKNLTEILYLVQFSAAEHKQHVFLKRINVQFPTNNRRKSVYTLP